MIGWTEKASEHLFTDLNSLWTEQLNIMFTLTWQIIAMDQIQLEFMAALTVSLGGAHIRIEIMFVQSETLKSQKDWLSLVNLCKSFVWQMCSEVVSWWASVSIQWATALSNHYHAELLWWQEHVKFDPLCHLSLIALSSHPTVTHWLCWVTALLFSANALLCWAPRALLNHLH